MHTHIRQTLTFRRYNLVICCSVLLYVSNDYIKLNNDLQYTRRHTVWRVLVYLLLCITVLNAEY